MTQTVCYSLFDPTGNKTILAETPIPKESQPFVAKKLMEIEPSAEQVGFVSLKDPLTLQMAGDEFCGNATLCAAALFLSRNAHVNDNVTLHVSGSEKPISVRLSSLGDNTWNGTVTMPEPIEIKTIHFANGLAFPTIFFPGIAHVIMEKEMDPAYAEELAVLWCEELDVPAVGLMFTELSNKTLKPLVYVREADTLFWESSCASGTCALGAYLYDQYKKPIDLTLIQPGGALKIAAQSDGSLLLNGNVSLLRSASVEIDY